MLNNFDISKKTDLTSRDGWKSDASKDSYVMGNNWLTQESEEQKPDLFGFKSFSSKRKLQTLLNIIFSKTFPKIGRREMSR